MLAHGVAWVEWVGGVTTRPTATEQMLSVAGTEETSKERSREKKKRREKGYLVGRKLGARGRGGVWGAAKQGHKECCQLLLAG